MRTSRRASLVVFAALAPAICRLPAQSAGSPQSLYVSGQSVYVANSDSTLQQFTVNLDGGLALQNTAAIPAPDADPPSTTDRIDGVVISSIDSKPVSRVLVTSADRRFAALTDFEGRFSFDLRRPAPQPGNPNSAPSLSGMSNTMQAQFQLRKPGYTSTSVMVYFSAARPDTPQAPLQFVIQPSGTITGRVDAGSGDLPQNIIVQLHRKSAQQGRENWNAINSARIDADGSFRVANLAPGDYKIGADAVNMAAGAQNNAPASITGFLPAFFPDAANLDTAVPIHISAGEAATANLTLRRATFYRVTIAVAGDQAQGFRAMLSPATLGSRLNYNSVHRALEGYLPNGEYDAHLASNVGPGSPNAVQLCATIHISVDGAPVNFSSAVTLHPIPEIPVEVTRDYSVTDPNQQPDPNARNYFFNLQPVLQDGSQILMQDNFGNGGRGGAPPSSFHASGGAYHFLFNCGDCYAASITSGGSDLLQNPLIIDDSVAPQPIFITLRNDFATLTGSIRSDGLPGPAPAAAGGRPSAIFMAIPLDRPEAQTILGGISSDNHFSFARLPPGQYLVLAAHDQQSLNSLEYRNPDVLRGLTSQGVTVTLTPGSKTDIEVPLMPGSSYTATMPIQVLTLP